jgi:hypothetical protein
LGLRVKQLTEAQIASGFRSPNAETLTAYRSALPGSQSKLVVRAILIVS